MVVSRRQSLNRMHVLRFTRLASRAIKAREHCTSQACILSVKVFLPAQEMKIPFLTASCLYRRTGGALLQLLY